MIAYGFCFYLFTKVKNTEKTASENLAQIEFDFKKNKSLTSVKNLMKDTKKEREQLSRFFVEPNGAVDFIESIESFVKITGVKTEIETVSVEFLKNKKTSNFEKFRISLKTEGSWNDTIHFLNLLETLPYQTSFDNIKLDQVSNESSYGDKENKERFYWRGAFGFSVLKMKNLQEEAVKAN